MQKPRFEEERFELWRKQALQSLERRNDQTPAIEGREFIRTMYGKDYFRSNFRTGPSVKSLSTDDLRAFHARVWDPANLIIAVSGDITAEQVLPKLEARMKGWTKGDAAPPAPLSSHGPEPGVYVVDKDDVNQTRVSIGHRTVTWDDPDAIALEIMNDILGGSGFTSRITKKVRSDEGLAYSAGSSMGFGRGHASAFRALFQSKNKSVARAIALTLAEIDRIRDEPVSQDELNTAVTAAIDSFPQRFSSAGAKASSFVEDQLWGRPADWWATYRGKVQALTAADLQRVSKKHLRPEDLVILVTGNIAEVIPGDPDHPDHRLETFAGEKGIQQIAMPDPVTMVYPHEPRPLAEAKVEGGQG
jgi:predicted Zn-dependent peptidase